MKFLKISSFFALCLLVVLLQSCKKEQPEITNPLAGCDCAHEVSADFAIEEMTTPNPNFVRYTNTDTIYADKNVRFRAYENNASYEWTIGAEILYTREVTRFFDNTMVGQVIPVQLIVHKAANSICFPEDDGVDTVVKYLVVGPEMNDFSFFNDPQPRFEGIYRMKMNNQGDSIDISVDARPFFPPANLDVVVIGNYNGQGDTVFGHPNSGTNYRQFFFDPAGGFSDSCNWYHRLDGLYEVNIISESYDILSRKLIGRKIN